MKLLILLAPMLLLGCASSQQVTGPNGAPAYVVKCGNAVKSQCAEKAAALCPSGYTTLDRKADRYDELTKVGNLGPLEIKADTTTTLLVQCK